MEVGQSVKQAGNQLAETATEQVREVVEEAGRQARDLWAEGRSQVREQARSGQRKVADGLSTIADEMREMADKQGQSGIASELARQGAERVHSVASWLQKHEPEGLLDEVRNWARRHPGAFLLSAAVAGVVAGRVTGSAVATQSRSGDTSSPVSPPRPVPPPLAMQPETILSPSGVVPPPLRMSPSAEAVPPASQWSEELGGPGTASYPGGRAKS